MKTLTNKLVTSVLALVLTGAALSIGVFAWFTINNTANVGAFDGTVQTGEGFYVSLDGSNWKNNLTSQEMESAAGNITFQAVTADVTGKNLTYLDGNTANTSHYIEFDLYFVGSNDLLTVSVSSLNITSPNPTSWIPGQAVPFTDSRSDGNSAISRSASDAARVGFIDMIVTANDAVVFENPVGGTNTEGKGTFNDPVQDGDNQAVLYYNHFSNTNNPALTVTQFNDAHLYDTTLSGTSISPVVSVAQLIVHTDPTVNALTGSITGWNVPDSVTGVIGAADYKVGAVTVRVWIEGWDQEALNAVLSGQVIVDMVFEGSK